MAAITNTFTNGMMMDNDESGNNDDDGEAKRIKVFLGIVNEDIDRNDDGEDTMHIETEVAVEENYIVSFNYEYGTYHYQKSHQIKILLTIWCK